MNLACPRVHAQLKPVAVKGLNTAALHSAEVVHSLSVVLVMCRCEVWTLLSGFCLMWSKC